MIERLQVTRDVIDMPDKKMWPREIRAAVAARFAAQIDLATGTACPPEGFIWTRQRS